ncbi:hypothetical protein V6N11_043305 [Hibiscus sabdariffa]|uniref:Small ribosomal subunit protein uS7 domain-containing protein n=1 Tax=Hibiscus sabdariffa TaxID=183260 RepID=A0ABR2QZH7_9ROSI
MVVVPFEIIITEIIVQVADISLSDYVGVQASKYATYIPHTAGRYSVKRFRKAQCSIVERVTNSLMMHGRNNGKKLMSIRIVKHAMEIIYLLTNQNPIQVIVDTIVNRCQAVDISPLHCVNQAIYLLTTGARESAFRNIKTIAECLVMSLVMLRRDHPTAKPSRRRLKLRELPRPIDE